MVLLAGPLVAIVGLVAIFFVLRRKSVDKRSMYSARRSQIEHKVRAARQRTLTPHGRAEAPAAPVAEPGMAPPQPQPTVTWERTAYEAPPVAPPPPPPRAPAEPAATPLWETPPAATPTFDYPPAPPEPFQPAPEPTPRPSPSEPVWTPAPRPAEPLAPAEVQPAAASATAAGSWSIVSSPKDSSVTAEGGDKKRKGGAGATSSWQLASGDAPGMDTGDEGDVKHSSKTVVAVAQYAVLVVGLVMVLIGVLVMVANSHVT